MAKLITDVKTCLLSALLHMQALIKDFKDKANVVKINDNFTVVQNQEANYSFFAWHKISECTQIISQHLEEICDNSMSHDVLSQRYTGRGGGFLITYKEINSL